MSPHARPHALVFATLLVLPIGCASDSNDTGPVSTDADAATIERGATALQARSCAGCHGGSSLSGNPMARAGTQVYAANLTPDPNTGLGDWTLAQIATAILIGTDDEGTTLCAGMPRFGVAGMGQAEADDIAAYLKSVPPVAHEIPESLCP